MSHSLEKLFGSKCRKKILEKFILEYTFNPKSQFFIRELCRDIDEQINAVRRELENLEWLGILKSKMIDNKKTYSLNMKCQYIEELGMIFSKCFDSLDALKAYFKGKRNMSLLVVWWGIEDMSQPSTNNLIDILIIGDIDRDDFWLFLSKNFFGRKIKFAVITPDEFEQRLKFGDKLILKIINQPGNQILKDSLGIAQHIPQD